MDDVTITRKEWDFFRGIINEIASAKGEDCVGVMVYWGARRFMTELEYIELSDKCRATREECNSWEIKPRNCVVTEDKLHPINKKT